MYVHFYLISLINFRTEMLPLFIGLYQGQQKISCPHIQQMTMYYKCYEASKHVSLNFFKKMKKKNWGQLCDCIMYRIKAKPEYSREKWFQLRIRFLFLNHNYSQFQFGHLVFLNSLMIIYSAFKYNEYKRTKFVICTQYIY